MNIFDFAHAFFGDSAHWQGYDGIPQRFLEHLQYSLLALAVAAAIGLPVGLLTGHTGRGGNALAFVANAARALPSFGLLVLVVLLIGFGLLPVMIPLVVLAVPPILVTTYEAVRTVDPSPVDAARGMGMRESRILFQVEVPVALPLILSGLRSAAIQIVSTATIAAYVSLGGIGRYIIDGLYQRDYEKVVGGATLVAFLALVTLVLFWAAGRCVVSPGVRRREGRAKDSRARTAE
ncbi:ABC transporter permease [Streptomyces hirsutus]|uniref:ABC transporter permease n=1 Tax=Streptomyces hirsutus TaxID=35620 RepID=A0ABZ1GWJ2_9ACTN|nr:ABC transporter permease [Streptomyces hirsutus]WSD09783.1 ABC transporter permease [Streptomyces hirsutus]WTD16836.1 ABC transporter permease [Streptomyces hirsutus]WTD78382.1 ABC transporter permease [Streptomyces sp. NBC_01635]